MADVPVAAPEAAPDAPVPAPESTGRVIDVTPGATPEPTATREPTEQKPEKTFTQAELDEILEKRLAKERRKRSDLENRLRITEELHLRGKPQEPAQPAAPTNGSGEPSRDQYADYESFLEARAEWRAAQAVEKRLAERERETQQRTAQETAAKQAAEFRKRVNESAKSLEDFEDVIAEATRDASLPVARLAAEPFDAAENPGAVLYHLAKNPDEAERIAALSPARQAREIWLLDSKLKSQPQAQPSRAPAPVSPVGGKAALATDDITGNETPEEFRRKREMQIRKRRGG